MINHARNLLANLTPRNDFSLASPAEELIDPSYVRSSRLPGPVETVRRILFGDSPDRFMVNYRTRQLLSLAHASPAGELLTAMDPRVTYDLVGDSTLLDDSKFTPVQYQLSGPSAAALSVAGRPEAPDASGVVFHSFLVEANGDGTATVTLSDGRIPNLVFECPVEGGLSSPVPLRPSGYNVRLPTAEAGYSWLVEVSNRPQWDVGQLVAAVDSVGGAALENLFAGGEPYASCRRAWMFQRELPLRVGALVAAVVLRTEEWRAFNAAG